MDATKIAAQPETKLHFLDYWRIIRIRKTVILAVFLLVVITDTIVTFILPESYSSFARIRVDQNVSDIDPLGKSPTTGRPVDLYFIQTEFEVLQSEVILGRVIDDPNLKLPEEWGKKYNNGQPFTRSEAMDILKGAMELSTVRNTSIIKINVLSDKPEEARAVAEAIAVAYRQHRLEQSAEMASNGIVALRLQLADQELKVERAQSNVDWLRKDLKIADNDPNAPTPAAPLSVDTMKQLRAEVIYLESEKIKQETQLKKLKEIGPAELRNVLQTALDQPDGELGTLISDLNIAQQRLIVLAKDITPLHPDYTNAVAVINDLNTKIDRKVAAILLGLQTKLDVTSAKLDKLHETVDSATTNDLETVERSRPYYAAKQELLEQLRFKEILQMKISQESTDLRLPKETMVEIIDHAVIKTDPVKPKRALYILGGVVVGLLVGIGLAFFIEYLDTSVKTIDDVERTLQAPVLGVIPQNVGFLLDEGAESPHAEAYRVLRTNLLFSRKDDRLNSIAIVSAGAGEGKSTTVMNLATVFAQNGNRVVIVDSDLRRPTLHKMLRVTNSIGLTNYLLKQNTLEEVIQTTALPTLDFMASGKLPSSSMGILSSAQMKSLITELKKRYDFVFFDSPPIMGVSDASILASEVDLSVQVIQYRRYPQPMNIRAKQMIEKVGGNLLGIVLNNINMSQDESYYYYSGYYQEYYSKSEDQDSDSGGETGDKTKLDIKPKY